MVAAMVPDVKDTDTNLEAPNAISYQFEDDGIVLAVHVIPSEEVKLAFDVDVETATKELFP
jgi:hypothetical protein